MVTVQRKGGSVHGKQVDQQKQEDNQESRTPEAQG